MSLCIRCFVPPLAVALWIASSSAAHAAGEPCLRDTDCAGASLCVQSACTQPDPGLSACTSAAVCDDVCDDGFCKVEGIVCRSPAGACWVEDGAGQCACADGNSSGWSDGFNPDDPPQMQTDVQIQEGCFVSLADSCGTEAPTLPEGCEGTVQSECEAFVERANDLAALCGEPVPEVSLAQIADCCETQDDAFYAAYRACVLAIGDVQACPGEALDACEGQGGDTDNGDNASAGEGATTGAASAGEDEGAKSSCRVGPGHAPSWLVLLAGFGLLGLRRRASLA